MRATTNVVNTSPACRNDRGEARARNCCESAHLWREGRTRILTPALSFLPDLRDGCVTHVVGWASEASDNYDILLLKGDETNFRLCVSVWPQQQLNAWIDLKNSFAHRFSKRGTIQNPKRLLKMGSMDFFFRFRILGYVFEVDEFLELILVKPRQIRDWEVLWLLNH